MNYEYVLHGLSILAGCIAIGFAIAGALRKNSDNKANARIIAAAPDLLKALTWAVNNPDDNAYWIKQAKDAIAKATGAKP